MSFTKKLILLSLLSTAHVFAQQYYTANKIVFKHPVGFSQAELEAASGFHHGTAFTVDDLTAGAQRLSDTAYFDNVGAAVDGNGTVLTVIFDLTPSPAEQFLPIGFENFVWLSKAEIQAAVRSKMPLYNGKIPEVGPQADAINAALVEALRAKGVTAKVAHATIEPTLEHPARVIEFSVTSPRVYVSNLKIAVPADLAPLLQASAKELAGKPYDDGLAGRTSAEVLLAPMRNAGYVRAALSDVSFDPPVLDDEKVPLVLSGMITPGAIYRLAALKYDGAPLFSADEFAKTVKLQPGDVAAQNKLLESLKPIDDAYRSRGYTDVTIDAKPAFDNTAMTVAYSIVVTPGEVYHLKTLSVTGLDPGAQAEFDRMFPMHEGDAYNPLSINDFFRQVNKIPALKPYAGGWKAVSRPVTHTVELTVTFVDPNSSLKQKVVVH